MSPNKDETGLEMLAGLFAREKSFVDVAFHASILDSLMYEWHLPFIIVENTSSTMFIPITK